MRTRLTELQIRNALPRAKKYKLSDGNGLVLIVMPNGAKYWRFRYSFGDKRPEVTIGRPYDETSLKQARIEADKLRGLLASGISPSEKKLQDRIALRERMANTFGEAANAWFDFRGRAWAKRTSEQVREYLDKDLLPALKHRPLSSITTKELSVFIGKVEKRGAPDVAKKMRQWLAQIYSYARASGWVSQDYDPVKDLKALHLPHHTGNNYPHLSLGELPEFLRKFDSLPVSPVVKGATMLSLWTANRPGITRTLRWAEINLDEALWTIEKGREGMKRGYSHLTPLPYQAVAMLRELHALTGSFEYVFVGRNDPRKSISDGTVNGLLKRLGYRGRQTAHGFRHLVSTALNERGYAADWVERQLAHGDPDKTRGTYNKAKYLDQRRKMMQDWADALDELRGILPV
jgi:integrase